MTIITSVSQLATLPLQGICQGGQPIMSYNFGAGNKERVKKAFFYAVYSLHGFYRLLLADHASVSQALCRYFLYDTDLITYTALGTENLYGWYFFTGISGFLSAELYGTGTGESQSAACMLKKTVLLIP